MKEKLVSALGGFGLVVWYLITSIVTFASLLVLDFPFIVVLIMIAVVLLHPFVGDIVQFILWVWSFVIALNEPIDVFMVIYFIAAAIYVLTTLIPFVLTLFRQKKI